MHCNSWTLKVYENYLMKTWVLLASFFMIFQARAESACAPLLNSCSYYNCMSRALSCSPQDYFESFGEKYCSKFVNQRKQFSLTGQAFLKKVATCLRAQIEMKHVELSCSNAKAEAARDHIRCYVRTGFCELNILDQYRIFRAILKPVLLDKTFLNVAREIALICQK